ncbi:UvrD-helicase domain-containing protein [Bacteroidota bacterium]
MKIYKASAGSGKTYKLTLAYLQLIFNNPLAYRRILAVTFTNKAASEMKSRILDRLYKLSLLSENSSSEDLESLMELTGKGREEIVKTSGHLLTRILNDYSRFSVGTIDRFFQGIIRAFTKEMGLPASYNLELDNERILSEAIDRMYMRLGEDPELLRWLLSFAESRIEEAKHWNFKNEIAALGKQLFSEGYQSLLMNKEMSISRPALSKFIAGINESRRNAQDSISRIAQEAITEVKSKGYEVDDFLRKHTGPAGFLAKFAFEQKLDMTAAQKEARFVMEKWVSKNENDEAKKQVVESICMPAFQQIYQELVRYNSANEISKYIYALGIMKDLSDQILDINDERNIFLLSDASRFLRGLIGNNPTPFIYEKTGNAIDHIMLDEFQDTSVLQWENFLPLIEHTLSAGYENVIVGDVKQSIYRWRNSDWKILAENVQNDIPQYDISIHALKENWRSKKRIIQFNNTIFSNAIGIMRSLISQSMNSELLSASFSDRWNDLMDNAYSEVIQEIPDKTLDTGGYIRVEVLETENTHFKEAGLDRLVHWITDLQDAGFAARDIAILVRTNREGAQVAEKLMEDSSSGKHDGYNLGFVSNESLFLHTNPSIRLLIYLLRYIHNPADRLNEMNLRYYKRLLSGETQKSMSGLSFQVQLSEEMGEDFINSIPELKRMPLYELTERLIHLFSLEDRLTDLPYIQAFQEMILDLQKEEPGSLHDFLTYWDDFGNKKSITVSEEQDAIRILTIHKAKGLQYKAVILPFCNWSLGPSNTGFNEKILWCPTLGTAFSEIPLVPLRAGKNLLETCFADHFVEEMIMSYVDSINLLYVGLTRAEDALIIGVPQISDNENVKYAGHLILRAAANSGSASLSNMTDLSAILNSGGLELGLLQKTEHDVQKITDSWEIKEYPVHLVHDRIQLRMKSKEYFLRTHELGSENMDFGNIMHDIFSGIKVREDISGAVQRFVESGLIKAADAERLEAMISEKTGSDEVKHWFEPDWKVYNERDILIGGNVRRPDRVMINDECVIVVDYKFGKEEHTKYEKQVLNYLNLLKEMGYKKVEGFVWYVILDKVVQIA